MFRNNRTFWHRIAHSMQSAAGSSFKEVTMELGGKSPLIICDDADINKDKPSPQGGNISDDILTHLFVIDRVRTHSCAVNRLFWIGNIAVKLGTIPYDLAVF